MKSKEKQRKPFSSMPLKASCLLVAGAMAVAPMAGCSAISGMFGGGETGTRGTVNTLSTLSQRTFQLEKGAVNDMCNGALKFTYLDMQRRPMSTFSGEELASAGMSGVESTGEVSELQTNDIVVQVDISFTWNQNTYIDATTLVLGQSGTIPQTLAEILYPGTLMYVQGTDANGEQYLSGDIIAVNQDDSTSNVLATSSSWNYNILNTPLPETSVTSQGSFLLRVASTATNLELVIVSPVGGQDIGDPESVFSRSVDVFTLPLT